MKDETETEIHEVGTVNLIHVLKLVVISLSLE